MTRHRLVRMARRLSPLALALLLLSACAPPPSDPITGVMCDWVTWIKTVGLALSVIGGFGSIMIFAVSRFGAGVVWAPLYDLANRLVNGAIIAFIALAVGVPVFWMAMEYVGAQTCP